MPPASAKLSRVAGFQVSRGAVARSCRDPVTVPRTSRGPVVSRARRACSSTTGARLFDRREREAIRPCDPLLPDRMGPRDVGTDPAAEHEGRRLCREISLRRPGGSRRSPRRSRSGDDRAPRPARLPAPGQAAQQPSWGEFDPYREVPPPGWPSPDPRQAPPAYAYPVRDARGPQARRDPVAPARAQRHLRRSVQDHPLQPEGDDRRRRAGLGRGDDRPDRGRAVHRVDRRAAARPEHATPSTTARSSASWSRSADSWSAPSCSRSACCSSPG